MNMLIDLLSPANYIMVNRDAIQIFGLTTAVYCSQLLTVYKKVVKKKKFLENNYFQVDRKYITDETSLSIDEQLKCDANLQKINVIAVDPINPDIIFFNVETFSSILACEDIKVLDKVSAKVQVNKPKGTKEASRKRYIQNLKDNIRCSTYEVLVALRDWIDALMGDPKRYLTDVQVQVFKDTLDDYCDGDLQKALEIIKIATVHQYIDCQWAINVYEKSQAIKIGNSSTRILRDNAAAVLNNKVTSKLNLGEEVF